MRKKERQVSIKKYIYNCTLPCSFVLSLSLFSCLFSFSASHGLSFGLATPAVTSDETKIASPHTTKSNQTNILILGTNNPEVKVVQVQLKALGYYKGTINGVYDFGTEHAVAQFQKEHNLKHSNGKIDLTTRNSLAKILATATNCDRSSDSQSLTTSKPGLQTTQGNKKQLVLLVGILGIAGVGAIASVVLYLRSRSFTDEQTQELMNLEIIEKPLTAANQVNTPISTNPAPIPALPPATELIPTSKTSVLTKFNIVEELIQDLHNADPMKRRLAIWNLGQQGDSRAVQPLIDLMSNVDSQQRGLILSALAEIGARTLKPMKRALAISIQDESSQVRQNAIRDLLRICDMMGQMSYILRHALEDADPEVQEIARYALNHLSHFRVVIDPQTTLPENPHPDQN